jgi:4a-hydroxytetrahydrobiopterin dehydratase
MGGLVPIGYDVIERRLVVNESEAETVRGSSDVTGTRFCPAPCSRCEWFLAANCAIRRLRSIGLIDVGARQTKPTHKPKEDTAMAKLTSEEIATKLKTLAGWEYKDDAISKRFQFKSFMDGIHFTGKVAEIAEAADHHPDILVNYTRVTFTCSTHDQGGVTEKDFALANEIERAFTSHAT